MLVKIVTLFLIGIVALAMFGRLRVGRLGDWRPGGGRAGGARTCPKCGRYQIGRGPCPCGHPHNTRT